MGLQNWHSSIVGKHADVLTGYPFSSAQYLEGCGGVRLLRGDNVMPRGIRWENPKFWKPDYGQEISRFELRQADVVVAMDRTWISSGAKTAKIKEQDIPSLLVQRVARLRAQESLDQEFLYQLLSTHRFAQYVLSAKTETAVPHISASQLREFPVLLPPLPEQHKIAEILQTWDDAIDKVLSLRRRRLAVLEAEKFRLLFSDEPEVRGSGRINGWSRVALGNVFAERNESGFESGTLLSVSQVAGVIAQGSVGRKDTSNGSRAKYKRVVPGDIAYNTMRMWQGAAGLSSLDGLVSPAYTVLTPVEEQIDPRFAAHLFKTKKMMFLFQRHSQGLTSDTWNLKYPAFSKIEVQLPPLENQRKISAYLDAARLELDLLDQKIEALKEQKRGLMQQLLTGKIRVNVGEGTK